MTGPIVDEDDFRAAVALVHPHRGDLPIDEQRDLVDRIAQALTQTRATAIAPLERLFAGGPDTVCRTRYVEDHDAIAAGLPGEMECVEVPMEELRAAFDEARNGRP